MSVVKYWNPQTLAWEAVVRAVQGPRGLKGDKGDKGDTGDLANLDIGTVTTGSPAAAHIDGNFEDGYELDLVIPSGITPSLSIGTVDTGAAAATITGTDEEPVLNLTLPTAGANGVDTAAIQDGAVTSAKIAADAVGSSEIAADAVGSSELADNAVDTAAIADGAVTAVKLAVQPGNLLTDNQASVETDTTGFTNLNACTIARSTAWSANGSASLAMTATGSGSMAAGTTGNTGGPAQGGVAVTVGGTYTGTVVARLAAGGTRTARVAVYWYTSGGTYVSNTASAYQSLSTSADTILTVTGVAPATAAYAGVVVATSGTGSASDVLYIDALSLHRGAGGQWQLPGIPVPGQSRIAVNNAVDLSGTGTPEGVVTAAPGSTWLQTDSTTDVKGWIKWVKATGTGNTGWIAGPEADTGWRDVSAGLLNSWTATALRIRRIGWIVQLQGTLDGTSASNAQCYTLPAGFLPKTGLQTVAPRTGGVSDGIVAEAGTGGAVRMYGGNGKGATQYLNAMFQTADAWPSSLPGTAA